MAAGPAEQSMFEGHDHLLREWLSSRQLVDAARLQRYAAAASPGRSLAAALLAAGELDRPTLLEAVADLAGGVPVVQLPERLAPEVVGRLDGRLAWRYGVVPLEGAETAIRVAAVDPLAPELATDLAFALGRDVQLVVGDPAGVRQLLIRHYGGEAPSAAGGLGHPADPAPSPVEAGTESEAELEELAGQSSIIEFVDMVLAQAVRERASDVHFEPFEHGFKIRCRIDGTLREMAPPAKALALPIISRLKVLAGLNITERRRPQDGRIKASLGGRLVDLRVSTLPTQFGESVVLRVLDQTAVRLELDQLGLPEVLRRRLEAVIRRPHGMFVVSGPTGSGKTTTLYSCLRQLNDPAAKVLTVEDPVEYEVDGLLQVPVNPAAGLTFARALRTFLRQDPDIIMVGEIRDLDTAQIAVQAALTGHLVLTTLHANDAPSAVTRLADLGLEPFLLASTLEGVLTQRLVRRICPACKIPTKPEASLLQQLSAEPAEFAGRPFFSGAGCAACQHTGFAGRLGIFEFLPMTEALRELVVQNAPLAELRRQATADGMTSLRAAGLQAILAGETTVEEVLRYV